VAFRGGSIEATERLPFVVQAGAKPTLSHWRVDQSRRRQSLTLLLFSADCELIRGTASRRAAVLPSPGMSARRRIYPSRITVAG
jgi:hypothetical protein